MGKPQVQGCPQVSHFGLSNVQRHKRSGEGEPSVFLKNALDGSGISRSILKEASKNFPKTGFVDFFCTVGHLCRYILIFFIDITMKLELIMKVTFIRDYDSTFI